MADTLEEPVRERSRNLHIAPKWFVLALRRHRRAFCTSAEPVLSGLTGLSPDSMLAVDDTDLERLRLVERLRDC